MPLKISEEGGDALVPLPYDLTIFPALIAPVFEQFHGGIKTYGSSGKVVLFWTSENTKFLLSRKGSYSNRLNFTLLRWSSASALRITSLRHPTVDTYG